MVELYWVKSSESELASVPELLKRKPKNPSAWQIHYLEQMKFSEVISTKSLKNITGLEVICWERAPSETNLFYPFLSKFTFFIYCHLTGPSLHQIWFELHSFWRWMTPWINLSAAVVLRSVEEHECSLLFLLFWKSLSWCIPDPICHCPCSWSFCDLLWAMSGNLHKRCCCHPCL